MTKPHRIGWQQWKFIFSVQFSLKVPSSLRSRLNMIRTLFLSPTCSSSDYVHMTHSVFVRLCVKALSGISFSFNKDIILFGLGIHRYDLIFASNTFPQALYSNTTTFALKAWLKFWGTQVSSQWYSIIKQLIVYWPY